jgi:23S rRNA (uracil1939-C5)-methyltransferase
MICRYASNCSGCSEWSEDYATQAQLKTNRLQHIGSDLGFSGEVKCHTLGPVGIRDRGDLQWRKGEGWGFLDKSFKSLTVIEQCPLFSEPLQQLFTWWSSFQLDAPKTSVRLRISPEGRWGVWLDMANVEVKNLLSQDVLLTQWVEKAHIEIGQRFKVLKKVNGEWKLRDPELRPWFSTTDLYGRSLSVYGSIGSFSQAGFAINKKLVERVLQMVCAQPQQQVIELGAGAGNFTLGMAAEGKTVVALEQSSESLQGLERALQDYPHLRSKIRYEVGNFQKLDWGDWSIEESILFLDPPRSGIGENLIRQIPRGNFPVIAYVACGIESWYSDGKMLRDLGYQLVQLEWVDQFPNTPHLEVISLWQK